MMNDEKISIIVPVYKVEPFIEQCVDSIINQTYKNLEIILVDDGSPDNCPQICEEYKSRDDRVKVIHKENGGLSDARNAGVEIATGDYIGFVDSDDWVDETMYSTLYQLIKKYDADISEIGIKYQYPDSLKTVVIGKESVLSQRDALCGFLDRSINIQGCVWGKLYKSQIAKRLKFPVGRLHEDAFYTYRAIYESEKYAIGEACLYNYRQNREGSIMAMDWTNPCARLDILDAFEERNVFFENRDEYVFAEKSKAYYYRTMVTFLRKTNTEVTDSEMVRKIIAGKINCQKGDILKNKTLTLTWKAKYLVLRLINRRIFEE